VAGELADLYVILAIQPGAFIAGLEDAGAAGEDFTAKFLGSLEELNGALGDLAERMSSIAADVDASEDAVADGAKAMADGVQASADAVTGSLDLVATSAKTTAEAMTAAAGEIADTQDAMADAVKTAADTITDASAVVADSLGKVATAQQGVTGSAADLDAAFGRLLDIAEAVTAQLDEAGVAAGRAATSMGLAADSADDMSASMDAAAASADAEAASNTKAGESAAGFGATGKLAFLAVGAAAVYGIDKAMGFQGAMEQLHTQAGLAQNQIGGLSQKVLALAGQVGEGPDSLAESLYHVASNMASTGATGTQMLDAVKVAAEGAQVGGANLVDVTNALGAAIASGIPGVQNYTQAMGYMNATVGAGDMTMQDLSDAFGTGVLANIKMYGVSLQDVSAALATFGDNNIRGAKAGTDLRMAVQALVSPATTAGPALAQLGLKTTSFADAMKTGGLNGALQLLVNRLHTAGVSSKDYGEMITDIFGKKAGPGIGVLVGEFDRFEGKYKQVQAGADSFAADWTARTKTMGQQWDDLKSGADALAISFGQVLLPAATALVGALAKFGTFLEENPAVAAMAGAILGLAAAFKIALSVEKMFGEGSESLLANPMFLALAAAIALAVGLYELYTHCKTVRDIVADVGHALEAAWTVAVHAAGDAVTWFVNGPLAFIRLQVSDFAQWWDANSQEIDEVWHAVWTVISDYLKVVWGEIKTTVTIGLAIFKAIWVTQWDFLRDQVTTVWHVIKDVVADAMDDIETEISIILDLLTGHWGKAWHGITDLAKNILPQIGQILKDLGSGWLKTVDDLGGNLLKGFKGVFRSITGSVSGEAGKSGKAAGDAFAKAWDKVFSELGAPVVRAFDGVKKDITSSFDSWWKSHGNEVKEVWRGVTDYIRIAWIDEWDVLADVLKPVLADIETVLELFGDEAVTVLKLAWAEVVTSARITWDAVRLIVTLAWDTITASVKMATSVITVVVRIAWDLIAAIVKTAVSTIEAVVRIAWDLIVGIFDVALDLLTGHWSQAWSDIKTTGEQLMNDLKDFYVQVWNDIKEVVVQVWNDIKDFLIQIWNDLKNEAVQTFNSLRSFLTGIWHAMYSDVQSTWNTVVGFFRGIPGRIVSALGNLGSLLVSAGEAIIQGLVQGVENSVGSAVSAVEGAGKSIVSGIKSVLGISSPSKVMHDIALEIGAGIVKGLEDTASEVSAAAKKLAGYVKDAFDAGDISSRTDSSLTAFISKDNTRLQALANQRGDILATIKAAEAYAASTTTATEGDYSLTDAAGSGGAGTATAATILATLKIDVSQIQQFKANIAKLAKMGLNKGYIDQLIQAGPVSGGPVAAELAAGSWAQISQINTASSAISAASTSLGQTAADAMYDSGKDAGKGFLAGLEGQQAAITAMMTKIADSMVATIRKELKISSPSQVMREHGQAVAQGLAMGIADGTAGAEAAAKRLAGAVSAGVSSGASGVSGGGTVINLRADITVPGGFIGSPQELSNALYPALQKMALETARRNPGTGNGLSLIAA
jgi:TP901 family phage tail tape measure protein